MESVFVNRTLNLKNIKALGFDMDHTLVNYNIKSFEEATHGALIQKLIKDKNYPTRISNFKFNFQKIIRGLIIDTEKGMFLKVSRYRSIRKIFHGEEVVNYIDRRQIYPIDYVDFGLNHPRFSIIESHFSISPSLVFMQLVELKKTDSSLPSHEQMFSDIDELMAEIHDTDIIKKLVMENPEKYLIINPQIALELEKWTKHDRKLFLITNSNAKYCSFLMNQVLQPFLKKHKHWTDLFHFIITSADKPGFFYSENNFDKLDSHTFKTTGVADIPEPGFYQAGHSQGLTKSLNLKEYEILYIGDQVYTDVVLLKQKCGWRTALVIEELSREKKILKMNQPLYKKIKKYMNKKQPLEKKASQLISKQIERKNKKYASEIKKLVNKTEHLDQLLGHCIQQANVNFNPYWGELMRVGAEESLFASQAERFSCIYMTDILDFLSQSPRSYFRASKRLLPHEMKKHNF